MQKKLFGIVSLFIVIIAGGIFFVAVQGSSTPPVILSQKTIEAKAVVQARENGLIEAPATVVSKKMTLAEFHARLGQSSRDSRGSDSLVWLVWMRGKTTYSNPPANGAPSTTSYANMYGVLTDEGLPISWGSVSPGYEKNLINLNAPIVALPVPVTDVAT